MVSEIGDHFNNIAVFSLAVATTRSGLVVSGVMLSRAIPAMLAGPLAGVVLDRLNRKRIMIASDLVRAVVALGFILTLHGHDTWLLYLLSALLMCASPFFTSGRSAILPSIATSEELHTANSLTQTTQWTTLTIGTFLGGTSVRQFGYDWAFAGNALSFLFSALCISRLFLHGPRFRAAARVARRKPKWCGPWHEYREGLRYMQSRAADPGAAHDQHRLGHRAAARRRFCSASSARSSSTADRPGLGCSGDSPASACCAAARSRYCLGRRLSFRRLQARHRDLLHRARRLVYFVQPDAQLSAGRCCFIALSRAGVGVSSVLNMSQLLRIVPNEFRGRVFATMESCSGR